MKRFSSSCSECGYVKTSKTLGLAEHGLRMHSCEKHRHRLAVERRQAERVAARARGGVRRECEHMVAHHEHGTYAAYVLDRCRCAPCWASNNDYENQRRRNLAYGRSNLVDAQPVREHLARLAAAGMGLKTVSRVTGVSTGTLGKIVYGTPSRDRGPSRRVTRATETQILAVQPRLAGGVPVDATGTHRRIQALVTQGWSLSVIASRIGMLPGNLGTLLQRDRVLTSTQAAVKALYDELWDQRPPENQWREKISASRARGHAARNGWVPPLAWDDDEIDDPAATPHVTAPPQRGTLELEDLVMLIDTGATWESLKSRTGLGRDAIERRLYRHGRSDLVAVLTDRNELGRARRDHRQWGGAA